MQATYKFREADEADALNLVSMKREMEFLLRKVGYYRHCLYAGKPLEEYLQYSAASAEARCPKPAWV